jgi:hypothetical protein
MVFFSAFMEALCLYHRPLPTSQDASYWRLTARLPLAGRLPG